MKQRIISMILIACLLLSVLPLGAVFAAEQSNIEGIYQAHLPEKETHVRLGSYGNSYNSEQLTSLSIGDVVILTANTVPIELDGLYHNSNTHDRIDPRDPNADTASCGQGSTYFGNPNGQYPLTVEAGSIAGSYAFRLPEGYYLNLPEDKNYLSFGKKVDAKSSWTVSFDEENNAIIKNVNFENRTLKWNSQASIFR